MPIDRMAKKTLQKKPAVMSVCVSLCISSLEYTQHRHYHQNWDRFVCFIMLVQNVHAILHCIWANVKAIGAFSKYFSEMDINGMCADAGNLFLSKLYGMGFFLCSFLATQLSFGSLVVVIIIMRLVDQSANQKCYWSGEIPSNLFPTSPNGIADYVEWNRK